MNKIAFILMFVFSVVLVSCEKDQSFILSANNYPTEIVSYVQTNYPGDEILQVIKETDDNTISYDVLLKSGIKLEFNKSFQLVDIE